MIIKFSKDTEVSGRLYLAGQSHDFDAKTAQGLIKDGAAVDPSVKVEAPAPKPIKAKK